MVNDKLILHKIKGLWWSKRIPHVSEEFRKGWEQAINRCVSIVEKAPACKGSKFKWTYCRKTMPEDVLPYNKDALYPVITVLVCTGRQYVISTRQRRGIRRGVLLNGKADRKDPIIQWEWVGFGYETEIVAWAELPAPPKLIRTNKTGARYEGEQK